MITYFAFVLGLAHGLLFGMGVWLAYEVSFKFWNNEIYDTPDRDNEHSVLPDR